MTNSSHPSLKVILIGAGVRGTHLTQQLSDVSYNIKIVGVVEPNDARRLSFSQAHRIPSYAQFMSWEAFFDSDLSCDAAIIATMDNQHTEPALACLKRGCHILIEKPLSDSYNGCIQIHEAQKKSGLVVSVCHTLRYMEAFRKIKQIVEDGVLGRLIHVEHIEAIGHLRFAHNYVRGRWAKEEDNTFLLLHKCCHDIDFIAWIVSSPCHRVSSFGSLSYFIPSNAPFGSGKRCLDDCRIQDKCFYSALRLYSKDDLTGRVQDLGESQTPESRLSAIKNGPFGACVWHASNNVVDHQVVSMEFANGITATCTVSGYSSTHGRRTRVQGTKGELLFDEASSSIVIQQFAESHPIHINFDKPASYHPEDKDIVEIWLSSIHSSFSQNILVDSQEALKTHAIVFAAERSRKEKRTVEISELVKN
jgi:predicted dehydrogenase